MKSSHYQQKSVHYGIAHTRLARILELAGSIQSKKILDVGCARGYVGQRLREKGNWVSGIEMSEPAASVAVNVLDKVYIFDVEYRWPEEIKSERFNLAVVAEVLEHVFDPVEVLKAVSRVLESDGQVIITTPNFLTWTNRLKILFGLFRYTEQGLLDFGHIRFFTYGYLKQVLAESDFKIITERHIIFPGKLTRILKFWPSLFATQFVLKVQKI